MREGKQLGQYFTPDTIVKFITDNSVIDGDKVLDPASGEGAFMLHIKNKFPKCSVTGIELDRKLYNKTLLKLQNQTHANVMNANFFDIFQSLPKNHFDSIVGNPPYIRFQRFKENKESLSALIKQIFDISINGEASSWVYFTLLSLSLLKKQGRLGFLVPREILFAKYAQPLRNLLKSRFRSKILLFDDNRFPQTIQRTAILLAANTGDGSLDVCYTKEKRTGLNVVKVNKNYSSDNWIQDRLTDKEVDEIEKIKKSSTWVPLTDLVDIKVSLVTGCKNFFVLPISEIKRYKLKMKYFMNCLSSPALIISPTFAVTDLERISNENERCMLLNVTNKDVRSDLNLAKYIRLGQKNKFNQRYKCRIRNPWFVLPGVKIPHAFLGHLMHRFPKFAANEVGIASINNSHNVWLKNNYTDINFITTIFYNYLTLITVELLGKIYGGGNLELNPLDCKGIYIPNPTELSEVQAIFTRYSTEPITDNLIREVSNRLFRVMELDVKKFEPIYRKLVMLRLKDNETARSAK
ncbi:MAG: N-6 DNA methylase [Planctomycetes bacterium]|nr:N-6 DNA methylase [Planctomycetota bacterium]